MARERSPLSGHAGWVPAADRPDPVGLLEIQNLTREPDLVPVRHGRMWASPFTFYRGAAKIMATDLKDTPTAGLKLQLCGDAHLSSFGGFASPERALVFDLNDFDETLPGPFEYDVKRMAASFTIAARNNGFNPADIRDATLAAVAGYRDAMAEFAVMGNMEIWYAHRSEAELMQAMSSFLVGGARNKKEAVQAKQAEKYARKNALKARYARQPAGPVETGGRSRRPRPDREPTTSGRPRPRPGGHVRLRGRADRGHGPPRVPGLPSHAARGPPSPARALRGRRRGPQSRRRG